MRKSNWIIIGVLVLASIIFLAMWYMLGFNLVDNPLDLVLTIIWWLLIIAICVIIHVVESRRQRTIRTTFTAPGLVYNTEKGVVKLKEDDHYVPIMKKLLSGLDYDFDKKDLDNNTKIRFKYIVHTDKFADNGKTWTGDVIKVTNPNEVKKFNNEAALAKLLENVSAA